MNTLNKTDQFSLWLDALKNVHAKAKIMVRLKRAEAGNFGDVTAVGEGISEMRIDFGPGYRVYFAQEGRAVYLLVCGGDKSTQTTDIGRAKAIWRSFKECK
ncbi:Type II toxin-antitoxin system RelE/ParE family toxin [Pararobbsia alpina]|uniref:type II toxin-antitoxin system RelE/ParE family toxin n=1 Tax=Pararobbsia alpina TaxID=621374 RepID=UPI0039A74962